MEKIGNSSNEQSWWDFVSPVRDDLHIEITGPHFGLNESNFRSQEKLQKWSEEMYSYAVASSEDACLGLTYLVKYIEVLDPALMIDGLSLAIALCRVCDAAKVSHLNYLLN